MKNTVVTLLISIFNFVKITGNDAKENTWWPQKQYFDIQNGHLDGTLKEAQKKWKKIWIGGVLKALKKLDTRCHKKGKKKSIIYETNTPCWVN